MFARSVKSSFQIIGLSSSRQVFLKENNITWTQVASCMNRSHKLSRNHKKVYMPGEKIPSRKDKKITIITDDSMSVDRRTNPFAAGNTIFNEVMAEAVKSIEKKHIVLEGQRMVEEGFLAGLEIHQLFFQKSLKDTPERLKAYISAHNVKVIYVSQTAMKVWSSLTTPPGIIGVFVKPKPQEIEQKIKNMKSIPVTIICDNIREPGNLGAILRSAAGAGCKRILLSKGCTDPWDSKALRAGCGAHFYLPIIQNYPLWLLSDCMELQSSGELDEDKIWNTERENTQGEIVEEENSRETTTNFVGHDSSENLSSPPTHQNTDDKNNQQCTNIDSTLSTSSSPALEEEEKPLASFALFLADNNDLSRKSVPVLHYTDVEYKKFDNVFLVVGGETEGLSKEILRVTSTLQQTNPRLADITVARLQIPLSRSIESLNAGHAFACIVFEMLRQYQS